MATVASKRQGSELTWLIVTAVLAVIGLGAWVVQLTQGLDVLGVGQAVVWGAYIAAFFVLAGAGAGLVMLSAAGEFGVLVVRMARRQMLLGALGAFIAAGIVILMDIGKPERVFSMLFSPNFKSMFVWDFYSLALSVVLVLVCLFAAPKSKVVLGLAGLFSLAVVVVEGWILSVSAGTALWHSSLIPVAFLVEGLVLALSVLVLAGEKALKGLLAALLLASLVLVVVELVTVSYGGGDASTSMAILSGGNLAMMYWGGIVLGIVVPMVMLWMGTGAGIASVLAILGVFVAKLDLLVAGQAIPFMGSQVSYAPSMVEIAGVVGMVGLACFIFLLGNRMLKEA